MQRDCDEINDVNWKNYSSQYGKKVAAYIYKYILATIYWKDTFYLYHLSQILTAKKGANGVSGQCSLIFDQAIPPLSQIDIIIIGWSSNTTRPLESVLWYLIKLSHPWFWPHYPFRIIFPLRHHCHFHFPFLLSPS